MDNDPIGPVSSVHALGSGAWTQPIAVEGEAPVVPGEPEAAPGARVDLGSKTAAAQTFVRTPLAEVATRSEAKPPAAAHALGEFALPAAQIVPATLVGLQVEAAWTWPLPKPMSDVTAEAIAPRHDEREREEDAPTAQDENEAPVGESSAGIPDAAVDADCLALMRALHTMLTGTAPPPALLAAAAQWQRGRCVVLASPQQADPQGLASAFVLWPRACRSLRVDARLRWREPCVGVRWYHARMLKEHHPRYGRQLVPTAEDSGDCEVQLGPFAVPRRRPGAVCLRIDAARRFWNALGAQWSLLVLVCSQPLACRASANEGAPC